MTWWCYAFVYDRGAKSREDEISRLVNQRNSLMSMVEDFRLRVEAQNRSFEIATEKLRTESGTLVTDLGGGLDRAKRMANVVKTKEITEYVTAKNDVAGPVLNGLIRLHDESAQADSDPGAKATGISEGGREDAGIASGVALPDLATAIRDNYAEAIERGAVIRAWQEWYVRTKAEWTEAARTIDGIR